MCGIQKSLSSSGYESLGSICEKEDDAENNSDKKHPKEKKLQLLEENAINLQDASAGSKGNASEGVDKTESSLTVDAREACGNKEMKLNVETDKAGVSSSTTCNNKSSPSSIVPEYKQILQNLFNLFNNSKRKYPIPMYPYVKGQSSALKKSLSINNNNT